MDTAKPGPTFCARFARVAELADAVDSKSTDESLVGSTPTPGTTFIGEGILGDGWGTEQTRSPTSGFRVFHDVPFDDFNIDHVLVGPTGVYAGSKRSHRENA